ncbi:unnamed protein product [Knipowitschia caucasica]
MCLCVLEPLSFLSSGGKSFLLRGETDLESVLGLGDLADLTVTNDEPDYGYDLQSSKESSFRKTELFRLTDPSLLSVSEDPTIKLWNLTKTVHTRK